MNRLLIGLVIFASSMGQCAQPPDRAIAVKPGSVLPAAQEARVALVIGNGSYADAPLKNPVSDARAMKAALEPCKFEVTLLTDASKRAMEEAIRTFGDRIKGGAVGLFYYAGHGVQVQGANFLIPVGARLDQETDVTYEGVDVGRVLDNMQAAGNKLNILILDACRNNPFAAAKGWRGLGDKGLAQVKAPTGTLVAYATAPGSTAADGTREHGIYTEALLAEMKEPGQTLLQTFQKVREQVLESSKGGQTPWESNSTVGDFYFRPLVTNITGPTQAELEATFWDGIRNSRDAKEFEAYLQRFPAGGHAELAQLKLKAAGNSSEPVVVNNLTEPWKSLQRDELETKQEYAQRVASLGPVKVGTATVNVHNYDIDTGKLVLPIQADSWAKPYMKADQAIVQMDRVTLRQLLAAGGTATVAMAFDIHDGHPRTGGLIVSTPVGSFSFGPDPSVPGAAKNAQGLWEADLALGSSKVRMVLIPAGTFLMGSRQPGPGIKSQLIHEVTISHDFWMGKFDVTQAQWEAVMGNNPSCFKGPGLPVENVTWDECQSFIAQLNSQGHGSYRLPTEAEWEYACRAGSTGERYGNLDEIAWYVKNSDMTTHPVGQKEPNEFGLHDMNGNVGQWCKDGYGDYSSGPETDPQGDTMADQRVYRGGNCASNPSEIQSALRNHAIPAVHFFGLGFRLVKTIP